MWCSPSIALKSKAWKEKIERKLEYALARMGFAFLKCKEKFYYMKHRIKEEMKPRFDEILPRIGINDIYYKSSFFKDEYTTKSTIDHVYHLTSMLEASSFCSNQFVVAYNMVLSQKNIYKLREDGMLHETEIQKSHSNQRKTLMRKKSIKTWHELWYVRSTTPPTRHWLST